MRRFMIAGTHSGCGKTTVTCAVLSALKQRGVRVSAFKCGPDYIDPMFHRQVLGMPAHNLDSFFCGRDTLVELLEKGSRGSEVSVVEGVMGFYDGDTGSACAVSEMTGTPVILVIDCRGMKESIGAVMRGFLQYRPNRIAGFIFNRLPASLAEYAKQLCAEMHTGYFGCMPVHSVVLGSRHLGLVTADEIADIQEKMFALGQLAGAHILLDELLALPDIPLPAYRPQELPYFAEQPVIAVARDAAFCFQYAENTELLGETGCILRYFSPLEDARIPPADGLILCGGYPELYAGKLSGNKTMLEDIRRVAESGMPILAECGGFLYLHRTLQTKDGAVYPMAGVIPANAFPREKLHHFGYVTLHPTADSLLFRAGETLKAHEFHYWDSTNCGNGLAAYKPDGRHWDTGHTAGNLYAGFPHLYFYADIRPAQRFAEACIRYRRRNGTDTTYSANK